MSLTSPVSWVSKAFSFYRVSFFWIYFGIFIIRRIRFACWRVWKLWFRIQVRWYVLFFFSLWWIRWYCQCHGVWCFFPNRNRVNWWRCSIENFRTKRSRFQMWSTHRNILAFKILIFPPSYKISFVIIVLFWPCPAHSSHCNSSKNITHCISVGPIRWTSDSGIRGTKGPEFTQCIDGWEQQMHEIWCLGSDGITREVHPTAQVDVGNGVVGQLLFDYLSENGRDNHKIERRCWLFYERAHLQMRVIMALRP